MTMQFVTGAHEKHFRLLCLVRDEVLLNGSNTATITKAMLDKIGLSFHDAERIAKAARRAGHFTYPLAAFTFSSSSFDAIVESPKKFRELVDDFQQRYARSEKMNNQISYVYDELKGVLHIPPHDPIEFSGRVARLVNFFYNVEDRKMWQKYQDITAQVAEITRPQIKDAVDDINKRVSKQTHNVLRKIIASRQKGNTTTSPNEYRWAL